MWPPPKAKDEEEKVGLKYTEAGKNLRLIVLPVFTSKTRTADIGTCQSSLHRHTLLRLALWIRIIANSILMCFEWFSFVGYLPLFES